MKGAIMEKLILLKEEVITRAIFEDDNSIHIYCRSSTGCALRVSNQIQFSNITDTLFGFSDIDFRRCPKGRNLLTVDSVNCLIALPSNNRSFIAIGNPETNLFYHLESGRVYTAENLFYVYKSEKERKIAEEIQRLSTELVKLSSMKYTK